MSSHVETMRLKWYAILTTYHNILLTCMDPILHSNNFILDFLSRKRTSWTIIVSVGNSRLAKKRLWWQSGSLMLCYSQFLPFWCHKVKCLKCLRAVSVQFLFRPRQADMCARDEGHTFLQLARVAIVRFT